MRIIVDSIEFKEVVIFQIWYKKISFFMSLKLVILVFLSVFTLYIRGCSLTNDGTLSSPGSCEGPIDRAVTKLVHAESFNNGCANNQVQYYKDNDPNNSLCGECVPGTAGVDDPELLCGINQFCNDNATCQDTLTSPLYNEPCPFEQGGPSSTGWCGPGLRCIQHICLPCENGVTDPRDGKYCYDNQWFVKF